MTPPRQPPRPALHLAEHPPPTPRTYEAPRRQWSLDDLGDLAETTAGKVEALTVSVDKEDDGIKASLVAIRRAQEEQARATSALARSTESAWSELGLVKDNTTAIGMSLADLQAAMVLRDVEANRRAKAMAIEAGKEASKVSESRGIKTAAAGMTGLGGVLWAVLELLKLFHIGG